MAKSFDNNWLIEHGRLVDPRQDIDRAGRLLIVDGCVRKIDPSDDDLPANLQRIDASGCIVAPGLAEIAAELGEPGCEEDETIECGTRAALHGGYTSLACTANTDPPIDTAATVEYVRQKAARADNCQVHVIGCVSKGRQGKELAEIGALVDGGAVALSDLPRPLHNTALLRRALEYCLMFDKPVLDHPEVPSLTANGVMHEGMTQLILALAPMPAEAEDLATSRDLRLLETTGGRLHLNSISTSGSVELVRRSKARGTEVSVGVKVANLCFDDEKLRSFSSNFKVNPPLRNREHIDACLEALNDRTIDVMTAGHEPKSLDKKMQELDRVPFGVSTLDTSLAQVITYLIRPGKLDWPRAIECLSSAPREVLGIGGGKLEIGGAADLVIIDPSREWTVRQESFCSRSNNSPLIGETLFGRTIHVWVAGRKRV